MRWFLISLGFLILGWLVFVVSFSFPSQAQAETWSCGFMYPGTKKKNPGVWVFKRKGDVFQILSKSDPEELTIQQETEKAIYFFDLKQIGDPKTDPRKMMAAVLYKRSRPHFTYVEVRHRGEDPVISIHGRCVID